MMNTKDATGFLAPLAHRAKALAGVTIPGEQNALSAEAVAAAGRSVGISATAAASTETALRDFTVDPQPSRVLICGSLHFAGTILAANQ